MQLIQYIMKKLMRFSRLILLILVGIFMSVRVGGEGNEYNIKAMFVLNFIKYVQWPFENNSSIIRIGVVGKSEMTDALRGMTMNRNESKQIVIDEINDESKQVYKIIFVSKTENSKMEEILRRFKGRSVLVISEDYKGKFSPAINLLNINNKIRFEINLSQAHDQGIKISSKLNELALTVKP